MAPPSRSSDGGHGRDVEPDQREHAGLDGLLERFGHRSAERSETRPIREDRDRDEHDQAISAPGQDRLLEPTEANQPGCEQVTDNTSRARS